MKYYLRFFFSSLNSYIDDGDIMKLDYSSCLRKGTIYSKRRQIFTIFYPYSPTVGSNLILSVGKFGQFLNPPPLRSADVLNGWFQSYNSLPHGSEQFGFTNGNNEIIRRWYRWNVTCKENLVWSTGKVIYPKFYKNSSDWSVRTVLNCISAISVHFSVPTKNLTDIKGRKCSILALNCTFFYNQLNMPEYSQRL